MRNSTFNLALVALILSTVFSSCSAIAGIFKAGMGFGIFMVVLVIVMIIVVISRAGKK